MFVLIPVPYESWKSMNRIFPRIVGFFICIASGAGLFACSGAQARAATEPKAIATHVVAFGSEAFQHTQGWERVTGKHDGRYRGSSLRSFRAAARATLDFKGKAVRLYGVMGVGGGLGIVIIDDHIAYVVSFFASRKISHWPIFTSRNLTPGPHRLTIEVVRKPRDEFARPGYVNIDEAEVVT